MDCPCPHILEYSETAITAQTLENIDKDGIECTECSEKYNLWLCLWCGVMNCGRYIQAHAIHHYAANNDHKLSICLETAALYCYKCDTEIYNELNDNPIIDQVQKRIIQRSRKMRLFFRNGMCDIKNEPDIERESNDVDIEDDNINDVRVLRSHKRSQLKSFTDEEGENNRAKISRISPQSDAVKINTKKPIGLKNLGNTCFMNAVFQALSHLKPFSNYIKELASLGKANFNSWKDERQLRNSKECEDDDVIIVEEFRKLVLDLGNEYDEHGKSWISPDTLNLVIGKAFPQFRSFKQHDAHEFLRIMLDRLNSELIRLLPESKINFMNSSSTFQKKESVVTYIFGGVLQSEVHCLECKSVSRKQDEFLDLSLDIPSRFLPKNISTRRGRDLSTETNIPPCNIHDCLSSFTDVEELADSEKYHCNNCKKKQPSTKSFRIRRLPNILCLHLKRFRCYNSCLVKKLDTDVTFPVKNLNMLNYTMDDVRDTRQSLSNGSTEYDLAAVIVHHGTSPSGGHYTTYAIHEGNWFHFDDSIVSRNSSENVAACKPYILFYVRRDKNILPSDLK